MKMTPTVKNCGSTSCRHADIHEHGPGCDPVDQNGIPTTCRWDSSCRCVPAFREELYHVLDTYLTGLLTVDPHDLTYIVMGFLKAKGINVEGGR